MLVLGIETSCDETAAAVVADGGRILSNVVLSQVPLHAPFRGVVPEVASRAHARWLLPVVERALVEAGLVARDVDAVAVTYRPGLIGALLSGVTAAKTLSLALEIPLVAVDHLAAHIYAALMSTKAAPPAVALVVSGGHTSLFRLDDPLEPTLLGATLDDAAGEAFDKVAKMLGLEYPGGPSVSAAARGRDPRKVRFPRALLDDESLDFSFSGLKTAVLYHVRGQDGKGRGSLPKEEIGDVAAGFQEALVDVLVEKCRRALSQTGLRRLLVTGGVAANERLRRRLAERSADWATEIFFPPASLCTDNAAMVAGIGYHMLRAGRTASLDLEAHAQ